MNGIPSDFTVVYLDGQGGDVGGIAAGSNGIMSYLSRNQKSKTIEFLAIHRKE